jgi:hypothetical protein
MVFFNSLGHMRSLPCPQVFDENDLDSL